MPEKSVTKQTAAASDLCLTALPELSPEQIDLLHMLAIDNVEEFLGLVDSGPDMDVRLADYLEMSLDCLEELIEAARQTWIQYCRSQDGGATEEIAQAAAPEEIPYGTGALEHLHDPWPYAHPGRGKRGSQNGHPSTGDAHR